MSSSRSIAAARNRRAGDPPGQQQQQQQQQQRRPNTSIGSSATFAPQQRNVRPPQQQFQQQQFQQQQFQQQQFQQQQQQFQKQFQQPQFQQQQPQFQQAQPQFQQQQVQNQKKVILGSQIPANTKLTVSDAIGLITLRLGSVEQFIIDLQNDDNVSKNNSEIPSNMTMIDTSVLTSIINRLDSLEKREKTTFNNDVVTNISNDVSNLKEDWNMFLSNYENKILELSNSLFVSNLGGELSNGLENDLQDYDYNINTDEVSNIQLNNDENSNDENNIEIIEDSENEQKNVISANLKNIISQELMNEEY